MKSTRLIFVILASLALLLTSLACESYQLWGTKKILVLDFEEPLENPLFTPGDNNVYDSFYNPALAVANNGILLAFAEGHISTPHKEIKMVDSEVVEGRKEKTLVTVKGPRGLDIVMRRGDENGTVWREIKRVQKAGDRVHSTVSNPCPVVDSDTGVVWLAYSEDTVNLIAERNYSRVFMTHSLDDGVTWKAPTDITASVATRPGGGFVTFYRAGPGAGIQLRQGAYRGRLVIPFFQQEEIGNLFVCFARVLYSDDHGVTWKSGQTSQMGTSNCQVVELASGELMMNMRSSYAARNLTTLMKGVTAAVAWSKNGGESWSDVEFSKDLVDPHCPVGLTRLTWPGNGEKDRVVFSNPAVPDGRRNLTVRLSYDGGESWPVAKLLDSGHSDVSSQMYATRATQDTMSGGKLLNSGIDPNPEKIAPRLIEPRQCAGSSLAALPNGDMACLYESYVQHQRGRMILSVFSLGWLTSGQDQISRAAPAPVESPAMPEMPAAPPAFMRPDDDLFAPRSR